MIQIHRPAMYLDTYKIFGDYRREAYQRYIADFRGIPTEELQTRVHNYDGKSSLSKLVFTMFSDEFALLRINAARQVLEERV